jgi:hypothetical protein
MDSVARSDPPPIRLSEPLIVTDSNRPPHILNRKYSAWRVLINTNVSRKSISREQFYRIVRQLNESWEFCFGGTPPNIKTFQPFTQQYYPMLAEPDNPFIHWKKRSDPRWPAPIASSRKKGEVGKKFGKIHLHGEFRLLHYGNVRLDYNALKARMKDLLTAQGDNGDLGITNPYISFQYLSDRDGDEEYLDTKGEEELARDQTENVLGPLTTLNNNNEERTPNDILASNESSNSRRRIVEEPEIDQDELIYAPEDNHYDSETEEEEEEEPLQLNRAQGFATRRLRPRPGQTEGPEYAGLSRYQLNQDPAHRNVRSRRRGKK